MAYDPFKGESGLLGNCDVEITGASFIRDPAYNNGQTLQLSLTMIVQGDDGGEVTENFSCGDGWDSPDGKTAVREDGRDRNFNAQSTVFLMWGGLVKVMAEDPAADKAIRALVAEHPLGPRDASMWVGLQVHIDRIEVNYGGEIGTREKLVIDGFNGIAGGATKATGATKKATRKKAPSPAAVESGGLTPEIKAKLDAIADGAETHDEFMELAIAQIPEVTSDEAVKAAVANDAEEGDGIWAEALARAGFEDE